MKLLYRMQCARHNGDLIAECPFDGADHRSFVKQAKTMSRMRGGPEYGLAIIEHTIVILTHEELLERARLAASQIISNLVGQ